MSADTPDPAGEKRSFEISFRGLTSLAALAPWRLLRRIEELEAGFGERLDRSEKRLDALEDHLGRIERRLDSIAATEHRLDVLEKGVGPRLDQLEEALRRLQSLLEELQAERLARVELRLDSAETDLGSQGGELGRLRDGLFPAAEARWEALFERLYFEVEELSSLLERRLAAEPLPLPEDSPEERGISSSLQAVQKELVESFRGSEEEIAHRLDVNLDLLEGCEPVLDLGCGRGEWLLLLRERGIRAEGIESDPALVVSARRRGLVVREGDVLDELESVEDLSFGAVSAFHLLEHLPQGKIIALLKEARRVLKTGGRLVIECPDPENLRVGASLFWLDPTHLRPLHLETLKLYARSCGLEILDEGRRHPFPPEQHFCEGDGEGKLLRLETRLDALLNGPRDFYLLLGKQDVE